MILDAHHENVREGVIGCAYPFSFSPAFCNQLSPNTLVLPAGKCFANTKIKSLIEIDPLICESPMCVRTRVLQLEKASYLNVF